MKFYPYFFVWYKARLQNYVDILHKEDFAKKTKQNPAPMFGLWFKDDHLKKSYDVQWRVCELAFVTKCSDAWQTEFNYLKMDEHKMHAYE